MEVIVGIAAGVAVLISLPKLKGKFGKGLAPALATAGNRVGDAYAKAARKLEEKIESLEDAAAERKHQQRSPVDRSDV